MGILSIEPESKDNFDRKERALSLKDPPWICSEPLSPALYASLTRRAIFDCFKWHTQANGRPAICSFPLVIKKAAWKQLTTLASMLAQETLAAEQELRQRSDLHAQLGLPAVIRKCLLAAGAGPVSSVANRVMRFDFHWTPDGWRISEANTDVAGGFIEASGITRLFAQEYPEFELTGDPALTLVQAAVRSARQSGVVGLMHLTVYSEDRQIMLYLAQQLEAAGQLTCLFSPEQLRWPNEKAMVECAWYQGPLDFLIRFVPAEWLSAQSARTGWHNFFRDGATTLCNPAFAVLTQSKRFPLVWDKLRSPLLTWQTLLPTTVGYRPDTVEIDDWVLKPALGHEGHNVALRGVNETEDWERVCAEAARAPERWVLQRRFQVESLETPEGTMYPCLGVYVIDGKVAGAYGRMAHRPLIDDRSRDVVVLVER